ncbi:unnamed protein product [Boreogadus saida]
MEVRSHGALRMNATKDQAKPGRTFSDRAGEPSGLGDYGLWSAPAAVQHESPYKLQNTSPTLLLLLLLLLLLPPRRGCPLGLALFGGGGGTWDSGLLHRRAHHQRARFGCRATSHTSQDPEDKRRPRTMEDKDTRKLRKTTRKSDWKPTPTSTSSSTSRHGPSTQDLDAELPP